MPETAEEHSLFPLPKPKKTFGPVYQGTAKQIRAVVAAHPEVRTERAGTIAQARSLASSIDRVSGHDNPFAQANGIPLAAMHAELRELMERINPDTVEVDPFQDLLDQMSEEEANRGRTEAPHAQE